MIELLWKYSQLVTLRVAQFFFYLNPQALRAFGFRYKFKKKLCQRRERYVLFTANTLIEPRWQANADNLTHDLILQVKLIFNFIKF